MIMSKTSFGARWGLLAVIMLLVLVIALPLGVAAQSADISDVGTVLGMPGGVAGMVFSVVFMFLFAAFKPQSWSRKTKQVVAILLSLGIGGIVAWQTWDGDLATAMNMAAIVVGTAQAVYVLALDKLGIDAALTALRVKILPYGPPPQP